MQPYFFPYLGYYQLLHAADRFVAYDDVSFIKQGWINRNRILINGAAAYITVPVHDRSSFRQIRAVEIDGPDAPWRSKLLKTIETAYRRAPQFGQVFPFVLDVVMLPARHIVDLAIESIRVVIDYLELRAPVERSSVRYGDVAGTGAERVLAICRHAGATVYINAGGAGRELYAAPAFSAFGITLRFLQPRLPEYQQFGEPFVPSLSIIDVLMFNSKETVQRYLQDYELH
jgi:hypothetical protein